MFKHERVSNFPSQVEQLFLPCPARIWYTDAEIAYVTWSRWMGHAYIILHGKFGIWVEEMQQMDLSHYNHAVELI